MFRRPPKFVATPEAPFENDKLGREDSIRNLTTLMEGTDTPMVMTVSAPWGSGKSSFVKMWKAYLESGQAGKKHPCIMFDAWMHDFHKEPLLAVMGEIGAFIAENDAAKAGEDIVKGCVKHLPKLLKASAGLAYLASPFISGMGLIKDGLEKSASAVDSIGKYVFEGHADQKESLRLFKLELEKFVQSVTDNGTNGPLYFFVDELDRCDPEYAIKLLESVKHFFDVDGIVFVLSVDRKKLGSMVRVRYGDGFDADGYLKRFVDVDYGISEPNYWDWIGYLCDVVLGLDQYPIAKADSDYRMLNHISSALAADFSMQPRDLEKVFMKIAPILKQNFALWGDATGFEEGGSYDVGKVLWGTSHWAYALDDLELFDVINNYFVPVLVLAFIKESSAEIYERLEGTWDDELFSKNFFKVTSGSYVSVLQTLFDGGVSGAQPGGVVDELKRYGSDLLGKQRAVAQMLATDRTYWSSREKEIRAQLDSLDNITFLSAEDSSENTDAA